ncbi:MAG: hypothetical protein ACLQQ4_11040 [Bacteroidia bacterium]
MTIQVVTMSIPEMQVVVTDAYKEGYLKAQREWEAEKSAKKEEPKFGEIIRGCKELLRYLTYKEYWIGSVSTLSKVAPQLVDKDERRGHGLVFRRACIDHAFENGFRFQSPKK